MIIRPATPDELDFCTEMMVQTAPWLTLKMNFEQCANAFHGPCKDIFVVEIETHIGGFIIIQTCGTFRGYIQTLCVTEGLRGQGIGQQLLTFAEETIRTYSSNMFICVSEFNSSALNLYQRFGFQRVGILPDLVRTGYTEILLRKSFGPMLKDD